MSHSIADASRLAVVWVKSSRSGQKTDCVETAVLSDGRVAVRDSKNPTGPAHLHAPRVWRAFVTGVTSGHLTRR